MWLCCGTYENESLFKCYGSKGCVDTGHCVRMSARHCTYVTVGTAVGDGPRERMKSFQSQIFHKYLNM